ncbi:bcl-2-binding component 3, isoforms 3/4-like [Onychostruthus taczanowskii]|uniref:bcl-2-binding component 3, isoforms 3/4-like n=1 Tax=Onychostruthus taczanowskii TaxID=356909 RepID=UPI001B808AEB|nr:bcl-2-binding component 3, isoforms 3/4-like [Onychostruthus taczanowskii]
MVRTIGGQNIYPKVQTIQGMGSDTCLISPKRGGRTGPGGPGRTRALPGGPGPESATPARPPSLLPSAAVAAPFRPHSAAITQSRSRPALRRRCHCRGRGAAPRLCSVLLPPRGRLTRGAAAPGFSPLGSPRGPQDEPGPTGPGAPSLFDRTLPRRSSEVWYSPHCTASAGGRTSKRRGGRRARVTPPPWRERSRPAPSRHGVVGHGSWNGPLPRARRSRASCEEVAVTSEGGSVPVPPPAPAGNFPSFQHPAPARDSPGSAPAPAASGEGPPCPWGPRRKGATQSCWVEVTK